MVVAEVAGLVLAVSNTLNHSRQGWQRQTNDTVVAAVSDLAAAVVLASVVQQQAS